MPIENSRFVASRSCASIDRKKKKKRRTHGSERKRAASFVPRLRARLEIAPRSLSSKFRPSKLFRRRFFKKELCAQDVLGTSPRLVREFVHTTNGIETKMKQKARFFSESRTSHDSSQHLRVATAVVPFLHRRTENERRLPSF